MIVHDVNCPQTSSLGRLFDAMTALLGLRGHTLYKGQAAIELEMQATACSDRVAMYPFAIEQGTGLLDVVPPP